MDQLVTIELFGQTFTFKAESEVNQAKHVADYLVKEVAKVENQQLQQSSNINKLTILILAALNIASKNIELKSENTAFLRKISERTAKLIRALNAFVQ